MNRSSRSKKQSKRNVDHTLAATAALPIAAPPAVGAPAVPHGFTPEKSGNRKGLRPARGQVIDAPGAAAEVKASATFSADFTEKTPQTALALMLERASGWRAELDAANAWRTYVRDQDAAAWRVVLGDLEAFKLAFAYASKKDPAIVARYPQLARMLGVRHEAGLRGARTRAAVRAKSAAAKTAPAAPAAKPSVVVDAGAGTNGAGNGVVAHGANGATARE